MFAVESELVRTNSEAFAVHVIARDGLLLQTLWASPEMHGTVNLPIAAEIVAGCVKYMPVPDQDRVWRISKLGRKGLPWCEKSDDCGNEKNSNETCDKVIIQVCFPSKHCIASILLPSVVAVVKNYLLIELGSGWL